MLRVSTVPIRSEKSVGLLFGGGLGVLYSVTTISGPPLAVALNNQGFSKQEFRAALGVIRLAESSMTALAYLTAGLFTASSLALIPASCRACSWASPSAFVIHCVSRDVPPRVRASTRGSTVVRHLRPASRPAGRRVLRGLRRDARRRSSTRCCYRFFRDREENARGAVPGRIMAPWRR